ncbi:MAG: tRNA uridine-5-carboxymethylaminomethyl(34) synthesis GTPase MnmE [Prevotella sp.]|nr:tRNA uridine-5-carboxymethylaminomethyl(34) synthesis GTPase MnmE [Prevotella sp.]
MDNTIAAIATATGGAIGIIRVSGSDAVSIVNKVFSKDLTAFRANSVVFGEIIDDSGEPIDEVLVSIFRAPHSYTGEDSVEISCHGSRYILNQVLSLLIEHGASQAGPGEFTQRAFMNGKMDLSRAEAVADVIAAESRAAHRVAINQLRGGFSSKLSVLRDKLLKMTSLLELELDFSDHEELEFADRTELRSLAEEINSHISQLILSYKAGQVIKSGIPVAIVGKTNVGKSTLLNLLLGDDRAIVSDIHGTTRDVIEDTVQIGGILFRFIDTAGLRHTDDAIERIGIERTYQKLAQARIVIWLIDCEPTTEELDEMQEKCIDKHLIIVANKCDLSPTPSASAHLSISAKQTLGINLLQDRLISAADIPEISTQEVIVTNARHYDALLNAHKSIQRVIDAFAMNLSGDLIAEDLRDCIHHLGSIVANGEITTQETLNSIFSHFCVGK